jgi:predicted Zn-dependent protease
MLKVLLEIKKVLVFLIQVLIIFSSALFIFYIYVSNNYSCIVEKKYSLGGIDKRFNLEKKEVLKIVLDSEKIWEEQTGLDLFAYTREEGDFKINFVYDKRQQDYSTSKNKKAQITLLKEKLEGKESIYQKTLETYQELLQGYNKRVEDFNQSKEQYQKLVFSWNNKEGGSEKEYDSLKVLESILSKKFLKISVEKKELSSFYLKLDREKVEYAFSTKNYNSLVSEFNQEHSSSEEFTQGNFDSKDINIFHFKNKDELKIVLAHEMGHVLKMGHVQDPESLMYFLMDEKRDYSEFKISEEDKNEFLKKCKIDKNFKKIKNVYQKINSVFEKLITYFSIIF